MGEAGRPRSPKTSERIARELATSIVDRDLPEGSKLPTEREMVEEFGVGRTTLREALAELLLFVLFLAHDHIDPGDEQAIHEQVVRAVERL